MAGVPCPQQTAPAGTPQASRASTLLPGGCSQIPGSGEQHLWRNTLYLSLHFPHKYPERTSIGGLESSAARGGFSSATRQKLGAGGSQVKAWCPASPRPSPRTDTGQSARRVQEGGHQGQRDEGKTRCPPPGTQMPHSRLLQKAGGSSAAPACSETCLPGGCWRTCPVP